MEFSSAISIEKYAILRIPVESSVAMGSLPSAMDVHKRKQQRCEPHIVWYAGLTSNSAGFGWCGGAAESNKRPVKMKLWRSGCPGRALRASGQAELRHPRKATAKKGVEVR